jgi:alpha-1,6-mannosyltransferase
MQRVDKFDAIFFLSMVLAIWMCPYTKAEESFTMQAVHDMVVHKYDIEEYDHLRYPGEVKQTGLAALGLGFMIFPYFYVLTSAGFSSECGLLLTRLAMGIFNFSAIYMLRRAVARMYGQWLSQIFMLMLNVQFHFVFYMSRTLPESESMFVATLILTYWIRRKYHEVAALLPFAGI